jgi:5-hydroxyisourate hydrolase
LACLTTHVLDTAAGRPAAGVATELYRLRAERELLVSVFTNAEGRTDAPLLEGAYFVSGVYELEFAIGAYFAGLGFKTASPPFLDRVIVRFGVGVPEQHYHVPLLVSPWSYATYRGS